MSTKSRIMHPYISRVAAISLAVLLMFQAGAPVIMAETGGFFDNAAPVIFFRGEPIWDGIDIDSEDDMYVRYQFTAVRGELAGAEETLNLPGRLKAAYAIVTPITGTDSSGNEFDVGELTINERGDVKVGFFDLPEDTGGKDASATEAATSGEPDGGSAASPGTGSGTPADTDSGSDASPGTTDTDEGASPGQTDSENTGSPGETGQNEGSSPGKTDNGDTSQNEAGGILSVEQSSAEYIEAGSGDSESSESEDDSGLLYSIANPKIKNLAADPNEEITVDFFVPVVIDTDGLILNDGSYSVSLQSGGQDIIVYFTPAVQATAGVMGFALPIGAAAFMSTPSSPSRTEGGDYTFFPTSGSTSTSGHAAEYDTSQGHNNSGVEITRDNGDILGDDDTVSSSDVLLIKYYFAMTPEQAKEIASEVYWKPGGYKYKITLPDGIHVPNATGAETMMIEVEEGGVSTFYQYGVLRYINDNTIYIEFTGDFWDDPENYKDGIQEGHLWLASRLDIGDADIDKPFDIVLKTGTTISLDVEDDRVPHGIEKKCADYDPVKDELTWQVVYTVGESTIGNTITFVDTLINPEMHQYATDSLTYQINGGSPATASNVNYASDTITYELNTSGLGLKLNNTVTFTYKTKLTEKAYTVTDKAGNKAEIIYRASPAATVGTAPIYEDKTPDKMTLVEKKVLTNKGYVGSGEVGESGTKVEVNADHEIEWQVTVYTKGLNIATGGFTLSDTLPPELEIVSVSASGGATGLENSITLHHFTTSGTTFSVTIPEISGDGSGYYAVYVVSYTTKVTDLTYLKEEYFTLKNQVELDIPLASGGTVHGDYAQDQLPGPGTGVSVDTNLMHKSGVYEYKVPSSPGATEEHVITWTVEINPYHLDIATTAIVTDKIGSDQIFVVGSEKRTGGTYDPVAATLGFTWDSKTKTWTLSLDKLATASYVFTFETIVVDKTIFHTDGKHTFNNTIHFNGDVNGQPVNRNVTGSASAQVKMLEKDPSGSYDYENQQQTWEITINAEKIAMIKDVVLTDFLILDGNDLSASMAVLIASIAVTDDTHPAANPYVKDKDYKVAYNDTSGELTVTFPGSESTPSICHHNKVIVTITTGVDVDETIGFTDGSSKFNLSNKATLTCDDYLSTTVTATGTAPVENHMLRKEGLKYDPANNSITYRVWVNPNELNLQKCTLTDTLPRCLKLDVASVELWEAVSTDGGKTSGKFATTGQLSSFDDWTYHYGSNEFTVTLPDGSKAYMLQYTCNVMTYSSKIENSVELKGTGITSFLPANSVTTITAGSYAHNHKEQTLSLNLYKVDQTNKQAISGVSFRLYLYMDDKNMAVDGGVTGDRRYIDMGVMKSDGKLNFYYLKPDLVYRLVEEGGPYDASGLTGRVIAINGQPIAASEGISLNDFTFEITTTPGSIGQGDANNPYIIPADANNRISISVTNDLIAQIEFFKYRNGTKAPLKGVRYTLTEQQPYVTANKPYIKTMTTGNDGFVSFKGVPIGDTGSVYTLKETRTLSNYIRDTAEYIVTVHRNRTYTITSSKILDASTGVPIVIFDSANAGSRSDLWKVYNTYVPRPPSSGGGGGGYVDPYVPVVSPAADPPVDPTVNPPVNPPGTPPNRDDIDPPQPYRPGGRLIPGDDNDYIEIDDEGVPVGRWTLTPNDDGEFVWIFDEFPPLGGLSPYTGDSSMVFIWILSFYTAAAALISLIWMRSKGKLR